MAENPHRREKAVFALLVAATLAALIWMACALGGDQALSGLLTQTQNRDAQGYLSEYEARLSRDPLPEASPASSARTAAPAPTAAPAASTAPAVMAPAVMAPEAPRAPYRAQ